MTSSAQATNRDCSNSTLPYRGKPERPCRTSLWEARTCVSATKGCACTPCPIRTICPTQYRQIRGMKSCPRTGAIACCPLPHPWACSQNTERTNIIGEIDALNKRYQNALLKNADGEMADDDFQEVKKLTKGKIEVLERRLNDLAVVGTEIKDLVASTLKKVANIDRRYENGDIEEKRLIVSSMFPD